MPELPGFRTSSTIFSLLINNLKNQSGAKMVQIGHTWA